MARNLASSSDHLLLVFNRTVAKSEKLASEVNGKVHVAQSIAEIVEKCDVVFTMLANDEVVKAVYADISHTLEVSNAPVRTHIYGKINASIIRKCLRCEVKYSLKCQQYVLHSIEVIDSHLLIQSQFPGVELSNDYGRARRPHHEDQAGAFRRMSSIRRSRGGGQTSTNDTFSWRAQG